MRTIGRIELKQNSDGTIENVEYIDGLIVELTRREAYLLKMLQDTCEGKGWTVDMMIKEFNNKPEDANMDDLFGLVWTYTQSRFAINTFKDVVSQLDETINRLNKIEEK